MTTSSSISSLCGSPQLKQKKQNRLPAAYYRGGTSRAIMFKEQDLPTDRTEWASIFTGAIGSPDTNGRQLDGLGGGLSSLSKVCVVGLSSHPDADVDYTFAAIGIKDADVDYSSNCGNMTSAVGPFAVDAGIVRGIEDGEAMVRIHNTNTGKLIHSTFSVLDGEAVSEGSFAIDGVSGMAAKIKLAFLDPAGSRTGKLLPTGNVMDEFEDVNASCIDAGNPCVFVRAQDLGVEGSILPDAVEEQSDLLVKLDKIRQLASVAMGLSKNEASATASIPKIAMVSTPSTHTLSSGVTLDKSAVDLTVRAISVGQPHRAIPITVAMAFAAAGNVRGSVVHSLLSEKRIDPDGITLGHPSGKIVVGAHFDASGCLTDAAVFRTARRLMDGTVYWK